jgi:hypothetical protein
MVSVRLTARGFKMFDGAARAGARRLKAIQVFVLESDGRGLWLLNRRLEGDRIEILLLKWELIESLLFDVKAGQLEERRPIGFR